MLPFISIYITKVTQQTRTIGYRHVKAQFIRFRSHDPIDCKQKKMALSGPSFLFIKVKTSYLNNWNSDTWKLVLVHISVTFHL
jgi:hypothetical protein